MPSQENLKHKQSVIDEISEKMDKASGIVVIDYIGISVEQANAMRLKLRDAGIDYRVYKNTLVKRAIAGTPNAGLADVLEGPSAFAFGYEEATAPARVLDSVIKEFKKMEFKAGLVEGVFYDAEGIKQIATIPSREILIARFLGSIQSPIGKLVRTFAAIADASGEPVPAAGEAQAEEAAPDAPAEEPAVEAAPTEEPVIASEAKQSSEDLDRGDADASRDDENAEVAAPAEEPAAEEAAAEEAAAGDTVVEEAPAEEAAPEEE